MRGTTSCTLLTRAVKTDRVHVLSGLAATILSEGATGPAAVGRLTAIRLAGAQEAVCQADRTPCLNSARLALAHPTREDREVPDLGLRVRAEGADGERGHQEPHALLPADHNGAHEPDL